MKNKSFKIIISISMLIIPISVFAHPGRTDSSGCHTCKTNCSSWGLDNNEYHCHNGNTYTNSKGDVYDKAGTKISSGSASNENTTSKEEIQNNNVTSKDETTNNNQQTEKPSTETENNNDTTSNTKPQTPETKPTVSTPVQKSEDTSLKYIKIDNQDITISEDMNFETDKKNIELNIEPTDNKSIVEFNNNELILGENEIIIKVTAEAGNTKEYKLIVTRKEIKQENNVPIQNNNVGNQSESTEEDSSGISSLLTLGGIGAAVYYIKKKK